MVPGAPRVRGLLTAILSRRKQLDLPHTSFALLPKFDAGKPGSETGINLKAGMRLKYMGSKSWLAPHVDRLLGDVAVLHSPFFGSGKLEYYLATRRPALKVRGVDAFEPVTNLHRCYLRQDPVFLRSLLRLAGRKIDTSCRALREAAPGAGPPAHTSCCASFSGKWGSFTQQRPLGLSSVRRMQQPPRNVTVQCQDALAYLRALPRQAPRQAIYADPPYIFPGRNYGTRRRGHDLAFHSDLQDALFASGLGALQQGRLHREAVLGQEQLQARAAGSAPGQSCCERRNGWSNPAPTAGLKLQSCAQHRIARPAPGPHQARTRPAPGPHQAPIRLWYGARSDFRGGNRHVPNFGTCPHGVPRKVPLQTGR